jgi:hypothetical protein
MVSPAFRMTRTTLRTLSKGHSFSIIPMPVNPEPWPHSQRQLARIVAGEGLRRTVQRLTREPCIEVWSRIRAGHPPPADDDGERRPLFPRRF